MFRIWFAIAFAVVAPFAFAADAPLGEDAHTQLMRATFKVSSEKATGTGFILVKGDKHLLVTAAHVFGNTAGDETTVIFRKKLAEGECAKEPAKLAIRKDGKPLWTKHPREDVAVIWIDPPKNVDLSRLPAECLASDDHLRKHGIHPGDSLACLGYPHREESSKAGFPLLRNGPIASFPILPTAKTRTFYLSTNTFEGDSSGPVYLDRSSQSPPLLLGLITGQQILTEEAKLIYGTTKVRHRLGLAIVIHASLIRETIDLLK